MDPIDFWIWLANNKTALEDFLHSDFSDHRPYQKLCMEMEAYSPYLIPELTLTEKGEYLLIVSCDGQQQGIPDAVALYEAFPVIKGWCAQLYRQGQGFFRARIEGVQFTEEELLLNCQAVPESDQYDVVLHVHGLTAEDRRVERAALIYLDHSIGEYEVMTKIRNLSLSSLKPWEPNRGLITLRQFAALLQEERYG
jgi:hypothetical protein